jgi:hypothetical protein
LHHFRKGERAMVGIAPRDMMKTPVGLVTIALTAAILLAASLLIVTGTRGEIRAPATPVLRAK